SNVASVAIEGKKLSSIEVVKGVNLQVKQGETFSLRHTLTRLSRENSVRNKGKSVTFSCFHRII
ncbi:hypothetical protein O9422_18395, partial [Proteus mirabilis]|uniref:hypothetical protein n=1 Tax=Proteus mirabilis TaxID=584 RepID=UPI0025756A15